MKVMHSLGIWYKQNDDQRISHRPNTTGFPIVNDGSGCKVVGVTQRGRKQRNALLPMGKGSTRFGTIGRDGKF